MVEETKISKRLDYFFFGPQLYEATGHTILVQEGLRRCRDKTQHLFFWAYVVICRQGLELKDADLVVSLGQGPRPALPKALSAVWAPLFNWETSLLRLDRNTEGEHGYGSK